VRGLPPEQPGVSLVGASALTVRLGGRVVLEDIDLTIAEGEIVTLIGPNGRVA
jgi:ABC-type uncharacterized transport system YnjBCD ATPase subunit